MRSLNLNQFNEQYWYCPDTDTLYEKTDTPYTFYRRERAIDLRDDANLEIQFADNVIGMNEKQRPIFGSNVNTHQPNYSSSNKHRRHVRRRFRKTIPSKPQPVSTQYLKPMSIDEYHQKYCTVNPTLNVWVYSSYNHYTSDELNKLSHLESLENDRKCLEHFRTKMGRVKRLQLDRTQHKTHNKRRPHNNRNRNRNRY